ncbi:MAG: ATP-binding cassette domain-containing protein [Negativicutes bacterium]
MIHGDIALQEVTVNFPYEQGIVLTDISCRFPAGEVSAILGESGSGKSVLGKAVLRLLDRAEIRGSIRWGNVELTTLFEGELRKIRGRRIFFLPQDPSVALNPSLSIGEQITEALEYHHGLTTEEAYRRGEAELTAYGFENSHDILRSYAFQLSGGMQQRVLCAMASVLRPEWILADEPTKGLDPLLRRQMIDLLRKLHRDTGGGLIFITHDMRLVRELATICVVLREGRLVEAGRVVDVWERPRTVYARRLVQASKFPDGEAEEAND